MIYLLFAPVALTLALYLIPALVLGQRAYTSAKDYFAGRSSPTVFQNSSIAYQLQMATFGPFFVWGLAQDYRPALVNSLFFLLGLAAIYIYRKPLLQFLDEALRRDTSITVHEFLARRYGDANSVRFVSSALTLLALTGIAIGEALGVFTVVSPLLHQDVTTTYSFVFGMLFLMFFYTVNAGNSGVMRSDQVQLGVAYVGLFLATIYLFLRVSPASPLSALLAAVFGLTSLAMLFYRRFRFLDTTPLRAVTAAEPGSSHPFSVRTFNLFERILNVLCVVTACGVVVAAISAIFHAGPSNIPATLVSEFSRPSKFSTMGIFALMILPLAYQFVDITNWQRIAAFERTNAVLSDKEKEFRRSFLIYVIESPLIWLLMCLFGTLAGVALSLPENSDISAVSRILSQGSGWELLALTGFLAAVFSIALSTMSAVFSASLCAIRYDILPSIFPAQRAGEVTPDQEKQVESRTIALGAVVYIAVAGGLYLVDSLGIRFGSNQYLSLLFAVYCAQLSFVPLIFGPLVLKPSRPMNYRWALAVLVVGSLAGLGTVGWYLYSNNDAWLWAAVPTCLGLGLFCYLVGRVFTYVFA